MTTTPKSPQLWRSIEELESDPAALELVRRAYPQADAFWNDPIGRRKFLKLMGASLALAGLDGCNWFTSRESVPYVEAPEQIVPGKPLFYATSHVLGGFAQGILAETHMARPTKIEGNPDHPATLGSSDVFMQASLLQLYDPGRGRIPMHRGDSRAWSDFYAHLANERFPAWDGSGGKGLRILTDTVTSPTLASLLNELLKRYPQARWHQYEPVNRDSVLEGTRLAFGRRLSPVHRIGNASVILSLGADFLGRGPASVRYARDFADGRRLRPAGTAQGEAAKMSRLYVAETDFTVTGASADHRLAVRPSRLAAIARALGAKLGLLLRAQDTGLSEAENRWVANVARDLRAAGSRALVLAGDEEPPELHALAHWINHELGAAGQTVEYIQPPEAWPVPQLASLRELVDDLGRGEVESLFILGTNPVYTAPADAGFGELLKKVRYRYCFDEAPNETSFHCDWYLPKAHALESWGDARAFDGTVSFLQPAVSPLFDGKEAIALVSALLKRPGALSRDIVKEFWQAHREDSRVPFDQFWERSLHDGFIRDSRFPPVQPKLSAGLPDLLARSPAASSREGDEAALEIGFRPDPRIWDGRFSSNAWLQELPKPLTQLTWDNAAILSPATAKKLGLKNEDVVRLELDGRGVEAPVFVLPGHADQAITAHLGYHGDERPGFNAYRLRSFGHSLSAQGLRVSLTGSHYPLASAQHHHTMEKRDLVLFGDFSAYKEDPKRIFPEKTLKTEEKRPHPTLYGKYEYPDEAWAMVIDLTVCIGCQACTIACQAENNIPVVGKSEVRNQREMHWIRVDRYFQGKPEAPLALFQPVPCMHCEDAPCEYVCPTEATSHDSSGLNQMVYNRCVGTRDCSNNCPYKVRRFNFYQYSKMTDALTGLAYNPDVTVREYGVMEKCTYCIQRISRARIDADKEDRPIGAGEVVTACQAACPTRAIVFGNKNNPKEEVAGLKDHPLNYDLLEELGTRPRTSYLARINNPDPALESL